MVSQFRGGDYKWKWELMTTRPPTAARARARPPARVLARAGPPVGPGGAAERRAVRRVQVQLATDTARPLGAEEASLT